MGKTLPGLSLLRQPSLGECLKPASLQGKVLRDAAIPQWVVCRVGLKIATLPRAAGSTLRRQRGKLMTARLYQFSF